MNKFENFIFGVFSLKNKKALENLALITQVGLSVIIPILLGAYIGNFVDKKLKSETIFTIIFIILGTVVGFMNIIKLGTRKNDKRK